MQKSGFLKGYNFQYLGKRFTPSLVFQRLRKIRLRQTNQEKGLLCSKMIPKTFEKTPENTGKK